MFETNLQQDEILQQEQNAFAAAAPLPTFSLPPNLNSKLVSNQQQANNRPRLCNLRSTWLSQQSIEEETFAEDKLIDITLPTPTLNDNSAIEKEILILLRIATSLCLLSSISASIFTTYYKKLHSLFLGEWILLFAWHTLHKIGRTEEQNTKRIVDIITLFSSIFMLVITFVLSHNNNNNGTIIFLAQQFTTSFGIALIYITQRLTKLKSAIQKEKELQQEKAQQVIDRALNSYSDRRQKFLSTVSQEIRDASLMVMATLEHFAPSSILTNTHELLSACSIAVPIASISAINTTIKQACHISSHFNLLSRMLREADTHHVIPEEDRVKSTVSHDFDVSELIQNVGDALAGMSAKLGVHFVIYHMDNGLYYSNVIGDEDAIKHALINLLRNILEGCTPGAFIELGLIIAPIPDTPKVKITFDIIQTASPAIPAGISAALIPNANFTAQLLSSIGGQMSMEDLGKNKTRVEVSLELHPGANANQCLLLIEKPSQILEKQLSNIRFSNEPTYEDLSEFIAHLKGVKMILHAPEKSVFAKHLTSCLTSWNTDISHIPVLGYTDDSEDGGNDSQTAVGSDSDASSVTSQQLLQPQQHLPMAPGAATTTDVHSILSPENRTHSGSTTNSTKVPSPAIEEDHIHSIPPAFILIDDDVLTLEKKLREFRDQPQNAPTLLQQRRHRRSKPRNKSDLLLHGTVAVIFFTSLTNYKRVRDTIHWISTLDLPPYMPRVVVIPKPAGPRRFLTALHTAWNNAIVEPQFIPIATSPLSPFVGQNHLSPNIHDAATSSSGGTITPGGGVNMNGPLTVTGNPMLTPHDPTARFSPGSRRGMRVHSPSGLQIESEKGNYFFDPITAAAVINPTATIIPRNVNAPAKLNTSPLLATTNMMTSPMALNGHGDFHTSSGTSSTNPTPSEIKRRLRSHSNSFLSPTSGNNSRRNLVDLSISQASPMQKPSPVTEEEEISSSNVSSMDSSRRPVNSSSLSTNASTETNSSMDLNTIPTLSNLPPHSVPPAAVVAASTVVNNAKSIIDEAEVVVSTPPSSAALNAASPVAAAKPKSKFNFKISNRKRKDNSKKQSDNPSPPITVLIVEDNIINQAILSTWMKKHQIKFSVACDGKEAVEKWKGGGFHLILMDIQLPVMDGIAATKMIRGIEKERKIGVLPNNPASDEQDLNAAVVTPSLVPSQSTPTPTSDSSDQTVVPTPTASTSTTTSFQSPVIIVALTASSLESDRQVALAAGCNDFLTKPVSLEWLETKIIEWGCMQALIDFDGWRKWKRSTDDKSTSATTALKSKLIKKESMSGGGHENKLSKEAIQLEKENLAIRTKELLKDESRAIVLVGINKRRMSTLVMDQHQDRSASTTAVAAAAAVKEEQDKTTKEAGAENNSPPSSSIRKKSSDPDIRINSELLSIPKQLEAREQKRCLEEQRLIQIEAGDFEGEEDGDEEQ